MEIIKNFTQMVRGSKLVVKGDNGTPPYTYSLGSGVGGSINQDGVFTAPSKVGSQEIIATDSIGQTDTVTIYISTHLQLIAYIISQGLGLQSDQAYIYNQKITLPRDERVYVAVKTDSIKPYAVRSKFDSNTNEEFTITSQQETVSIDIHSMGFAAFTEKDKILGILRSGFSQDLQRAYGFHIAKLPNNFNDISEAWESQIPYRFNITFNILYSVSDRKQVSYYESFETKLISSNGKTEQFDPSNSAI